MDTRVGKASALKRRGYVLEEVQDYSTPPHMLSVEVWRKGDQVVRMCRENGSYRSYTWTDGEKKRKSSRLSDEGFSRWLERAGRKERIWGGMFTRS